MNPVKATFEATETPFPAGTVAAGFLLSLVAQAGTEVPPAGDVPMRGYSGRCGLGDREITIADVAPGTYIGTIALVDADGAPLAPGVTDPAPIVVAEVSSLSFPVPSSLTLTRP